MRSHCEDTATSVGGRGDGCTEHAGFVPKGRCLMCVHSLGTPAHANDVSLGGILLWCFWGHALPATWAQLHTVLTQDRKAHHHFMKPKESSPVWTFSKTLTGSDWHIRGLKNLPSFFPWEQNLPSLSCKHPSIAWVCQECLPSSMAFSHFLHWGGGK